MLHKTLSNIENFTGCRFGGTLFSKWLSYLLNNKQLDKTFVYEYNNIGNVIGVKTYSYTTGSLGSVNSQQSFGYNTTYPDRLTSFGGTSISYNAMGCPTTVNGYTATWTRGKLSKLTNGSRITGTLTELFGG